MTKKKKQPCVNVDMKVSVLYKDRKLYGSIEYVLSFKKNCFYSDNI